MVRFVFVLVRGLRAFRIGHTPLLGRLRLVVFVRKVPGAIGEHEGAGR